MSYENGSSGYWRGSGTLGVSKDVEVICSELCWECNKYNQTCDAAFTENVETDDDGNIDWDTTCPKCNHTINIKEDKDWK